MNNSEYFANIHSERCSFSINTCVYLPLLGILVLNCYTITVYYETTLSGHILVKRHGNTSSRKYFVFLIITMNTFRNLVL